MITMKTLSYIATAIAFLAYFFTGSGSRYRVVDKLLAEYDYIIVGAGTSGCVLASRLTEDQDVTVLLVEAGDVDTLVPMSDVPFATQSLLTSNLTQRDVSVPQKHACQGMKNKQCALLHGQGIGGSSNINSLLYARGSKQDYDSWAAQGAKGWAYLDVLPYFIKAETNANEMFMQTGYHGSRGPLIVSDIRVTSLSEAFVQAGRELGYSATDVNGETQEGFMHTQATISRGRKWGVSRAYLQPAMARKNLHLVTNTRANKILFKDRTAVGVELSYNGTVSRVSARNEIVVAAGALGSAHLLLLSGVGPKGHLEDHGISLVADLPVGQNLQDHVTLHGPEYSLKEPISITDLTANSFWAWLDYTLFGTGYWSSPLSEGTAYIQSKTGSQRREPSPDLVISLTPILQGASAKRLETEKVSHNVEDQVYDYIYGDSEDKYGIGLYPTLVHPSSHGRVKLRSPDPKDRPLVDPQYLREIKDVKVLTEGIRLAENIISTDLFRNTLGAKSLNRIHPSCRHEPYRSDTYWQCYLRHSAVPGNQFAGTCKMGAASDDTAVVDPTLRVRGVKNLRVIDASVMPSIISGNTYIATVMIAEKGADLLRGINSVKPANITCTS